MDFEARFEKHLKTLNILPRKSRVLVACSGGPDSIGLVCLLAALRRQWGWDLALLHLNHRLRGREADRDMDFVKKIAKRIGLPFYAGSREVAGAARRAKESVEEAARRIRYDFFLRKAVRCRYRYVVLGHTLDDQAETVLMRILQGTGLRGLEGVRDRFRIRNVTFVRPLLPFTKKEILSYLKEKRVLYRCDRSNRSPAYLRNRIRLKLLPWLEREINPRVAQALARIPAIVREENEMTLAFEKEAWGRVFRRGRRGKAELARDAFLKLPAPLRFRVLNRALKKVDPKSGLSFDAWEKMRGRLDAPRFRHSLPGDIDLVLTRFKMTLSKRRRSG